MADLKNDEARAYLERLRPEDWVVDPPLPGEPEIVAEAVPIRVKSWKKRMFDSNKRRGGMRVYAEGDSWFHFPLPKLPPSSCDVLAGLLGLGYAVRFDDAMAGSVLTEMASPKGLNLINDRLSSFKPRFFIFSGGGNDMVNRWWDRPETNLFYLMNPAGSSRRLNDAEVKRFLDVIKKGYLAMAEVARRNGVECVFHSYANAYPSGKGVFSKTKARWFPFLPSDPYLAPVFQKRGYDPTKDSTAKIFHDIVDRFHGMLEAVKRESRASIRLVDSRRVINREDWHDEYHLWPDGFKKVANQFHLAMQ
jgi:hypothetical protein